MIKIAPSILAADILNLGEEIKKIESARCDWIHIDVMDGAFVPNLSYGPQVVKAIKTHTKLPLDVHLMIYKPENHIDAFIGGGADYLTIHVEATKNPKEVLKKIKSKNIKAGITLKPSTDIETLRPFLNIADMILIMTVEPGFGGQAFMADMVEKIALLRQWGYKGIIEVDGGINLETGKISVEKGAEVLVMGTAFFQHPNQSDLVRQIHDL